MIALEPLDWAAVEKEMTRIHAGIEFGVWATLRVQDLEGRVVLCYAKLTMGYWGFCDEHRNHITTHPLRWQIVAWNLLPDLLHALNEEAIKLTERLQHAVDVLRPVMEEWARQKEQEEHDSLIGLS